MHTTSPLKKTTSLIALLLCSKRRNNIMYYVTDGDRGSRAVKGCATNRKVAGSMYNTGDL